MVPSVHMFQVLQNDIWNNAWRPKIQEFIYVKCHADRCNAINFTILSWNCFILFKQVGEKKETWYMVL